VLKDSKEYRVFVVIIGHPDPVLQIQVCLAYNKEINI
jgi:hypothetical protein